jgi:hypothetical protein
MPAKLAGAGPKTTDRDGFRPSFNGHAPRRPKENIPDAGRRAATLYSVIPCLRYGHEPGPISTTCLPVCLSLGAYPHCKIPSIATIAPKAKQRNALQ